MEYRREDNTITLTVTELASYAYGVDRPVQLTEKYGFRQVWEDAEETEDTEEADALEDDEDTEDTDVPAEQAEE